MTMKLREIADCFVLELSKHGKHLVETRSEFRREINFEWHLDAECSNELKPVPWTVHTLSKRGANMMHSFAFRISHAKASLSNGVNRPELIINAGNWPEIHSEYSANPAFIAKAALHTSEAIDKFVEAFDDACTRLPWTEESEIMGKKLWMWMP